MATKEKVTLKAKDKKEGKEVKQSFEEAQAIKILKLPNSQWELADDKYTLDGKELSKKGK